MAEATQRRNTEGRMSLGQHLIELRKRLFRARSACSLGMDRGWFLSDFVLDALRGPHHSRSRKARSRNVAPQLHRHHRRRST